MLAELGAVRENYAMLDDDFQFPIVVARYLDDDRIPAERKRAFLLERAANDTTTRLTALLRNVSYVQRVTAAYARQPVATNLVAFPRRPDGRYHPGSWRDSNAGYANGRFAMDINAVWVPEALSACVRILGRMSMMSDAGTLFPMLRRSRRRTKPGAMRRVTSWCGSRRRRSAPTSAPGSPRFHARNARTGSV